MSTPTPDLANAARHMLGECIRDACGEDVHLPAWVADEILAEYDRRGSSQAWTTLIVANERMGKALTEIGLAVGLPTPSPRIHWGAPEILRRIRAQQAECERGHPAVGTDEAAEPMGAATPPPGGEPVENDFTEPLLPMLGRISDAAGITLGGPHWEGEVTHLVAYGRLWQQIRYRFPDEVGDLHRRFAASPGADTPAEPTGTAALLALCDALDRRTASEGGPGRSVSVEEIRRLLRASDGAS